MLQLLPSGGGSDGGGRDDRTSGSGDEDFNGVAILDPYGERG